MIIDVHAHLDHRQFDKDRAEVIKRAGDILIVNNGLNPESNRKTLELASKYSNIKAALGLYPIDALKLDVDSEIEFIRKNKDKIIAVGEVGLDYHWEKEKKKEEKENFLKFIKLAEETKKPLIVHSREAELDVIEMLESSKIKNIVLHCFGSLELVKRAIDNGFLLSIPANVTFSSHFQKIVESVELRNILTETDSPYLSPYKGKRNEPANIVKAIEKISRLKKMSEEDVEEAVWDNFKNIFKIKK